MPKALWLIVLMLLSSGAHSSEDENLEIWRGKGIAEPKIQFLGVGGWLLHWGGEGLLLAPSFSNPALMDHPHWPPIWVKESTDRIDKYMSMLQVEDVTMLLIGHGHYDHLLDVPRVMLKYAPHAIAYGSDTVEQILRATPLADDRIKSVESEIQTVPGCSPPINPANHGTWQPSPGGHIAALPIQNMHASQILDYTFAHGSYPKGEALSEVPTTVFGWKQGQSIAWLIDLLDDEGKTKYRIHFQDSAAEPPCGIPVIHPGEKTVDVEILGVGSWKNADNYPNKLLQATKPRIVLLGHWENFFGNDPEQPEPMRGQHVEEMVKLVKEIVSSDPAVRVYLPAPFAEIALPPQQ